MGLPRFRRPPEWGPEPVPRGVRILRPIDLFVLWSSLGVGLLVLQAGGLLVAPTDQGGAGLTLFQALLISVLGSIVGSLLLAAAGLVGARHGVPTMVSLRPVLGVQGSYIPSAFNALQLLGWTAFEILIMAQAGTVASGRFLGPWTPYFWMGIFGSWCTLLALGGPLVVVRDWLEKFGIWLVFASGLWITYQVFATPEVLGALTKPWEPGGNLLLALDLVIAMPISWWPLVSDYNRFARNPQAATVGTTAGYTIANTWFFGLGAALALVAATLSTDILGAMVVLAFGLVALLPILADETDNAFADIYSMAVSVQNVRPRSRQWKLILGATAIGAAGAVYLEGLGSEAVGAYENFLLLIGALFVPLLGVLLVEYALPAKGIKSFPDFGPGGNRLRVYPLTAWALGIVVYFMFSPSSLNLLVALGLLSLPPLVGASLPAFATAAATTWGLSRLIHQLRPGEAKASAP